MEDFTHWLRKIVVQSSESQTDPVAPSKDINLRFSFQTYDYWIIHQDSGFRQLHDVTVSPMTQNYISMDFLQFFNRSQTCEILFQVFKDWPVLDSTHRISVEFIWKRMWNSSLHGRRVNLHFYLTILNIHVFDEGDEDCGMVPASQSSIESLEMKIIEGEGGGSCSICMDDLREGLCMPCLHVFHVNCIKEWLMINHNCPLCRLEMPTDNDNDHLDLPSNS